MDFSDTPGATANTRRPTLRDFLGQRIRIVAGNREQKTSKAGVRFTTWRLTFEVYDADTRKVTRYELYNSGYALDKQLTGLMNERGQIDGKWLDDGKGLIATVVSDGVSAQGVKLASGKKQEGSGNGDDHSGEDRTAGDVARPA